MKNQNPSISIITPTYNSAKTLTACLESIKNQDYQGEIEIIIADGDSTDSTLEIARKYTDKIYPNPLKTGEAGKAVGIKHSKGEIIALIDSDNILPTEDWLSRMKNFKKVLSNQGVLKEPLYVLKGRNPFD
ncbi:MAG: glycosyltransferase [Euryarchaeota archaeon]|nr:glycosyltransferase [Euryarchaeota archaeon]